MKQMQPVLTKVSTRKKLKRDHDPHVATTTIVLYIRLSLIRLLRQQTNPKKTHPRENETRDGSDLKFLELQKVLRNSLRRFRHLR